jgi:hypothetical protein
MDDDAAQDNASGDETGREYRKGGSLHDGDLRISAMMLAEHRPWQSSTGSFTPIVRRRPLSSGLNPLTAPPPGLSGKNHA